MFQYIFFSNILLNNVTIFFLIMFFFRSRGRGLRGALATAVEERRRRKCGTKDCSISQHAPSPLFHLNVAGFFFYWKKKNCSISQHAPSPLLHLNVAGFFFTRRKKTGCSIQEKQRLFNLWASPFM